MEPIRANTLVKKSDRLPTNGFLLLTTPAASVKLRGGHGCSNLKKKNNKNPVLLSSLNHTRHTPDPLNRTGQDRTGQHRTGQDRTGQDMTGQDKTGQDRTEQDSTGQNSTGQDRTGQHRTGQDTLSRGDVVAW